MKRSWYVSVCTTVFSVILVGAGELHAQPPTPGIGLNRPLAYSPYLNLTRPGGTLTQNYYGLVQPQIQANLAILGLAGDQAVDRQALGEINGSNLPTTGHPTQFMNYGSYFLNSGAAVAGGQGGGGVKR
jgi:hypothetical protein